MKIDIKVVSTEIITPSTPTPKDVSNYKLSFLDQNLFPIFLHWTLFYKASDGKLSNAEISIRLKKSLSKTLTLYYPLAGRVVDNTNVHCNDQGIVYVEARADCMLGDAINEPIDTIELDQFNPRNPEDVYPYVCLIVQTTFFNCGGLAIGVAFNHKVCDGWSFSLFANSWAAISRGDDDHHIKSPIFNGAKLCPPRSNVPEYDPESYDPGSKEEIITKRFIFTASKINDLRDKYTNTTRPTKIEALTAFIFTRFMASDGLKKISSLFHVVNFRKRVVPPLCYESFGNFIQPAPVVVSLSHDDECGVVQKLKEAILSVDGSEYVNFINSSTVNPFICDGEVVPFMFSSFCRFPMYEADFGWGKPAWIGIGTSDTKNVVRFTDSPSEGSIEAWICLKPEDMAKLEADEEVLAYTKTK